jgi:hypothetical protein
MVLPWIRTCRRRILKRKIVRHCATSSRILPLASRPSHSIMHGQRPPHVRHVRRTIQPTHLQRGRCGRKPCSSITVHSPRFDCGKAKVRTPTCERALKQLPVSCESADGYFHDVQFALNSDRIGAPDDQAARTATASPTRRNTRSLPRSNRRGPAISRGGPSGSPSFRSRRVCCQSSLAARAARRCRPSPLRDPRRLVGLDQRGDVGPLGRHIARHSLLRPKRT